MKSATLATPRPHVIKHTSTQVSLALADNGLVVYTSIARRSSGPLQTSDVLQVAELQTQLAAQAAAAAAEKNELKSKLGQQAQRTQAAAAAMCSHLEAAVNAIESAVEEAKGLCEQAGPVRTSAESA